jgi:hypothetical protein
MEMGDEGIQIATGEFAIRLPFHGTGFWTANGMTH